MPVATLILTLVLSYLCLLTLVACRPSRTERRLQGTWRSNKEETVARWRREGLFPEKGIAQFENEILGKMTVTYSGRKYCERTDDKTIEGTCWVVESGEDFVVIEGYSKVWKRHMSPTIRFVPNGFWLENDQGIKGYSEKFDRVPD